VDLFGAAADGDIGDAELFQLGLQLGDVMLDLGIAFFGARS
jgi:hypothetical protein